MDGFGTAHSAMANITTRQQRRVDGYRVESVTGATILISADVKDDGRVMLFESIAAAFIDTSGEQRAFPDCLKRFSLGANSS